MSDIVLQAAYAELRALSVRHGGEFVLSPLTDNITATCRSWVTHPTSHSRARNTNVPSEASF